MFSYFPSIGKKMTCYLYYMKIIFFLLSLNRIPASNANPVFMNHRNATVIIGYGSCHVEADPSCGFGGSFSRGCMTGKLYHIYIYNKKAGKAGSICPALPTVSI